MPVSLYTTTMPPSLSIMPHVRGLLTMDGCAMQNFGYTVEQEGDSFALVFVEPSDAVKFCLQVSACERNEVAYRTNFLPQLQPLGALSWLTPASRHSCHHPRRPQAQQSLACQMSLSTGMLSSLTTCLGHCSAYHDPPCHYFPACLADSEAAREAEVAERPLRGP